MNKTPDYSRFPMVNAAWDAANALVDSKGNVKEDLTKEEKRFLKRKVCQAIENNDCKETFRDAVSIAQAVRTFMRSNCPTLAPKKPSRQYELLHQLSKELENTFSKSDLYLIFAGCRLLEISWSR